MHQGNGPTRREGHSLLREEEATATTSSPPSSPAWLLSAAALAAMAPVRRSLKELCPAQRISALLHRERARADRTGGVFSLVLFRVKDSSLQTLSTARLARVLLSRARLTDDIGWFSDRFLCVILPDTPAEGAWRFGESVCDRVAAKAPRPICLVYSYPEHRAGENDDDGDLGGGNDRRRAQLIEELRSSRRWDGGNGNGHGHGNGHHSPGHGNGHTGGTSNGNGNGHAPIQGQEADPPAPPGSSSAASAARSESAGDSRERAALLAHLIRGVEAGLGQEDRLDAQPVAQFLVRPLPWWKRLMDVAVACTTGLLLLPLLVVVAAAVKLSSPGPVFFRQNRSGLGGKPFTIYKFRTMVADAERRKAELKALNEQDGPAFKMARDPRVTRLGSFLRKTSLDELPQLWNVLRGDMSLVGPRPLPCEESDECRAWHRQRLDVTPGLTCIWQVYGRSRVTFTEWMRMDLAYARRRTLVGDLKLLVRTVPAVLFGRGAC